MPIVETDEKQAHSHHAISTLQSHQTTQQAPQNQPAHSTSVHTQGMV